MAKIQMNILVIFHHFRFLLSPLMMNGITACFLIFFVLSVNGLQTLWQNFKAIMQERRKYGTIVQVLEVSQCHCHILTCHGKKEIRYVLSYYSKLCHSDIFCFLAQQKCKKKFNIYSLRAETSTLPFCETKYILSVWHSHRTRQYFII